MAILVNEVLAVYNGFDYLLGMGDALSGPLGNFRVILQQLETIHEHRKAPER